MKTLRFVTVTLFALCCISAGSKSLAQGQDEFDGQPFKYTNTGAFVVGQPFTSYTSAGCPPVATVDVGTNANFSCKNTASGTRNAATECYTTSQLWTPGGLLGLQDTTSPYVSYSGPMTTMQVLYYWANAYATGPCSPGTYSAQGFFNICDNKTPDYFLAWPANLAVTVM